MLLFWLLPKHKNRRVFPTTEPTWIDICTAIFFCRLPSHVMMWRWRRFLLVCLLPRWRDEWKWRRLHLLSSGRTEFLQTQFLSNFTLTRFDLWLWILFIFFRLVWQCAARFKQSVNCWLKIKSQVVFKHMLNCVVSHLIHRAEFSFFRSQSDFCYTRWPSVSVV